MSPEDTHQTNSHQITTWLCCGVLKDEMKSLLNSGKISGKLLFLDSMLHMKPEKLETSLIAILEHHENKNSSLILVYGDCCSHMLDFTEHYPVSRVNAINCAHMLLGNSRYLELMHKQSFILLPEWTSRWETVMQLEMGLSPEVARDLMTETRKELVYLDTGLIPIPIQALEDCSIYTGLPFRIESVTLDHLLKLLQDTLAHPS